MVRVKAKNSIPRVKHRSPCVGFQELMAWQVNQYRRAVEERRLELSKKMNRYVDWKEAEVDFCETGCESHAGKWRLQFCGMLCSARKSCLLSFNFLNRQKAQVVDKTAS